MEHNLHHNADRNKWKFKAKQRWNETQREIFLAKTFLDRIDHIEGTDCSNNQDANTMEDEINAILCVAANVKQRGKHQHRQRRKKLHP